MQPELRCCDCGGGSWCTRIGRVELGKDPFGGEWFKELCTPDEAKRLRTGRTSGILL